MKKLTALLIISLTLISCTQKEYRSKEVSINDYSKPINNLFDFFDQHAYVDSTGVYYSEIDNVGNIVSEKVYTVALNRLIYGLAYTSDQNPDRLKKALKFYRFQKENLIGKDSLGLYSYSYVEKETHENSEVLDVWQQAYGLCGLSELYRKTQDKDLLKTIHALHKGFVARFHDDINGGFWGVYEISKGPQSGSKSLQSLMYPITAYMANLWSSDKENRELYEPYISENIDLLAKHGWNDVREWVNVKFDDEWNYCKSLEANKPCFTVTPGHNFQFSALMQRTKSFGFITEEKKSDYANLGLSVLNKTMKKPIFSNTKIEEGFYSEMNPETDEVLDKRKTWWQHTEAIIAITLAENRHEEATKLKEFFFSNFQDYKNGGEFFYLSENNKPITSELKGGIGKSTYHTIELIRFIVEN